MNKKQLIKRCLIDADAIETYPFADDKYENTPILRHESNKKWFGVVFEQDGKLFINLKAEPETISLLKEQYPESVFPAWHMNKTHWCKVDVNNIEPAVLDAIIRKSFDITAPKRKKQVKNIK